MIFGDASQCWNVTRNEYTRAYSIGFLAVDFDCFRGAAGRLPGCDAPCGTSRATGNGSISRCWHPGICRLGCSFLWQSVSCCVTEVARDYRLVHRSWSDIVSGVVRLALLNHGLKRVVSCPGSNRPDFGWSPPTSVIWPPQPDEEDNHNHFGERGRHVAASQSCSRLL